MPSAYDREKDRKIKNRRVKESNREMGKREEKDERKREIEEERRRRIGERAGKGERNIRKRGEIST